MQFLKKNRHGVISELTEEQVKKLGPSIRNKNTGESFPVTAGSVVPGYLTGMQRVDATGKGVGEVTNLKPVDSQNLQQAKAIAKGPVAPQKPKVLSPAQPVS